MASIKFCGNPVTNKEVNLIRELSEEFWGISRTELASTVCELLGWKRPGGGLKTVECRQFLEGLASHSILILPKPRQGKPKGAKTRTHRTSDGEYGVPLEGSVKDVKPVSLVRVENTADRELWKELVDRYHYLGFKVAFGGCLRYLIKVQQPVDQVVGCLQFSSPAWKVGARDVWIGWDRSTREKHLQKVVQNSRFLILPWCKVRGLASHILGQAARRIVGDWASAFNVTAVMLETFVEKERFNGTCYRAANWIYLGETKGRGRMDRTHKMSEPVKSVWVYPLMRSFRDVLST
jgi:hypothetical protein